VRARFDRWWSTRSAREQRLLGGAALALALAAAVHLGSGVARDLAATRARIEAQERDLVTVRRLARALLQQRAVAPAGDDTPLVSRVEAAASEVVGRERIASMTPLVGPTDGVALRLVSASLGETVRVLHEIERGGIRVDTLDLVKHPDDPARFDVSLEIAGGGGS
jgi:hypothetical protein